MKKNTPKRKKKVPARKASTQIAIGKNSIKYINDRMIELCKSEKLTKVAMPTFQKLNRDLTDAEIENELKPGHCSLSDVYAFIKDAPEETKDGWSNLFHLPNFVVHVTWSSGSGGWSVRAWSRGGRRWGSDRRVFSPATENSDTQALPSDALTLIAMDARLKKLEAVFNPELLK